MITRLHPDRRHWAMGEVTGTLSVRVLPPQGPSALLWSQQQAHQGCISALVFSPDGRWLASGGRDGQVHLWHTASGRRLATFPHGEKIGALCWATDGSCLTSAAGQCVRLWPVSVPMQFL